MKIRGFITKTAPAALMCMVLAGCAIRPLPGNFALNGTLTDDPQETPTFAIVQHIRCEARYAIASVTMDFIRKSIKALEQGPRNAIQDAIYHKISDEQGNVRFDILVGATDKFGNPLQDDNSSLFVRRDGEFVKSLAENLNSSNGNGLGNKLKIVQAFASSGVGFEFMFTTTENNNANAGILSFTFPHRVAESKLGLGGSLTRERKNVRDLKIVETIQNIVFDEDLIDRKICNEHMFDEKSKSNFTYPITGKINLKDSFSTYANLVVKAGVGKNGVEKGFGSKTALGKISTQDLTDLIIFTTTITGSADPSVTLDPLLTSANLSTASIGFTNTRTDMHQLRLIIQEEDVAEILKKLEIESLRDQGAALIGFSSN